LQIEDLGGLDEKDEKTFKKQRFDAESEILGQAEVICTTCIASFDPRLK